jgi:hypothetical protein
MMKRLLLAVALASVLAGASVSAAGKTQSSVVLNVPTLYSSPTSISTSWPRLGDSVTFTATYPDSLTKYYVYVNLLCYQWIGADHVLVYATTQKPDTSFLLGGTNSPWVQNGGPASCVANLFYWSNSGRYTLLADTDFEVN